MPRLLDLFSCAGGAAMGYHRAGFDVYGVDINPQPRYPFPHLVGDAVDILRRLIDGEKFTWSNGAELGIADFDAIHASPPCQKFTVAGHLAKAWHGERIAHPDLLEPTRELLKEWGGAWVIENVPGSPMEDFVTLCGSEFDMTAQDTDGEVQLRRHRQFESSVWLMGAGGCAHIPGMVTGSVFGHGGGWKAEARSTMRGGYVPRRDVCAALLGIDWAMTKRELSESIPPVYTEFIGGQIINAFKRDKVEA